MRRPVGAVSTAVYSVGLSPYRRIQTRAHDLRSRIDQVSMT